MKERPILFSGAMVRAILSGQKTQTRRVVNPYPPAQRTVIPYRPSAIVPQQDGTFAAFTDGRMVKEFTCPYGQPGDRLWVRETWQGPIMGGDEFENEYRDDPAKFQTPEYCFYAASEGNPPEFVDADDNLRCCWRPSIHMPRWACRIVLEIVSVRVERLQDISEADAKAEGLPAITKDGGRTIKYGIPDRDGLPGNDDDGWSWQAWETDPRRAFRRLWESINGHESWQANPWVWVVEFRRVTP